MKYTQIFFGLVVLSLVLLSGCSNGERRELSVDITNHDSHSNNFGIYEQGKLIAAEEVSDMHSSKITIPYKTKEIKIEVTVVDKTGNLIPVSKTIAIDEFTFGIQIVYENGELTAENVHLILD